MSKAKKLTARLIDDRDEEEELVAYREVDCHTALTRGLADYIRSVIDGAKKTSKETVVTRVDKVTEDWADPEQIAEFPSIAVYTQEPGAYDDQSFTPSTRDLSDGTSALFCSELTQVVTVDVWCSSKTDRIELSMLLEDAFYPVDWQAGLRLCLPFYHGAFVDYTLVGVDYDDGPERSEKRTRLIQFQLESRIQQIRVLGQVPRLRPRTEVEVED